MKRILFYLSFLFGLVCLFPSCQKAPFVTVTSPRSYTFTKDGGTQTISFTCNRDWSVSSSESWIQVSPSSGTASDDGVTVKVTCEPNASYDPRSATVTIKVDELVEAISISQETGIGLIVSPKTLDLTNAEQSIEIEVQKNVQYTVAIDNDCVGWIRQGGTKALTTDKITFTIAANTSYDNREGKITFKQLDGNLSETVSIHQSQTNGLFITTQEYSISNEAQTLTLAVTSNVEYEVIPLTDWVHHVETKALSSSTVVLSIDENETYSARDGKVEITQKNGSLKSVITIIQAGRIAVSSLYLNKSKLLFEEGETQTLIATIEPDNATDKTITWTSSDNTVANVDNEGKVTAIKIGTATITAKAGDKTATCSLTVKNAPEGAVHLGLSVFWAISNIGATNPEDYGDYFAWGEIETKNDYRWETYKWGAFPNLTKYNNTPTQGVVDNKTELDPEDDVAQVRLGGGWRMPSENEIRELMDTQENANYKWEWTIVNGREGWQVTYLVNNSSLFFPAAGWKMGAESCIGGAYWASTCAGSATAYGILLDVYSIRINHYDRCYGKTVRPVID